MCPGMSLDKSKYFRNSLLRLLIPCAIISYDALPDFIGLYSKRDGHKYQDDEVEKELHELVFRIQSHIYDGAFLQKLTAKIRKVRLVTPRFYVKETPPLTFSNEYSNCFWTSYFTKKHRTTDCKWFFKW